MYTYHSCTMLKISDVEMEIPFQLIFNFIVSVIQIRHCGHVQIQLMLHSVNKTSSSLFGGMP